MGASRCAYLGGGNDSALSLDWRGSSSERWCLVQWKGGEPTWARTGSLLRLEPQEGGICPRSFYLGQRVGYRPSPVFSFGVGTVETAAPTSEGRWRVAWDSGSRTWVPEVDLYPLTVQEDLMRKGRTLEKETGLWEEWVDF